MSRLTDALSDFLDNDDDDRGGRGGGTGRAAKVARCRGVVEDYLRTHGLTWDAGCMDRVEAFAQGDEGHRAAVDTCLAQLQGLLGSRKADLPEDVRKCMKRLRRLAKRD